MIIILKLVFFIFCKFKNCILVLENRKNNFKNPILQDLVLVATYPECFC